MLADYTLKTLDLWFWFGAFTSSVYLQCLLTNDDGFGKRYLEVAKSAKAVHPWLVEQFNRTLAEEQAMMQAFGSPDT
jgi:hypothetical protein